MINLKRQIILFCCLLFIVLSTSTSIAIGQVPIRKKFYKKEPYSHNAMGIMQTSENLINNRQIIIKFNENFENDLPSLKDLGLLSVDTPNFLKNNGVIITKVPESTDYYQKLFQLRKLDFIYYAEPDYISETASKPNDKLWEEQWALEKINMINGWDISTGNSDIIVAVLDSGVNYNHPDLQGRILPGYDFHWNDTDPMDDNGHGTMVAGVIASNSNNYIGIAGIDWNAKILPVKILDQNGRGSTSNIISGIYYAIEQGAHIINMSFGSYQYNAAELDALWTAYENGIILVAPSGNDGYKMMYPAAYLPVIGVGSTNAIDNITNFSNYGERLDLVAPGEKILSTTKDNSYDHSNGTSFSSPIVSGIASLLLDKNPSLSPDQLKWLMESTAVIPSSYSNNEWESHYGYGRVDAYEALSMALPIVDYNIGKSRDNAKVIDFNKIYSQNISLPLEDNWFSFSVDEPTSITIDLDVPHILDLVMWIDSYQGNNLIWEQKIDNGLNGQNEYFEFEALPGTYYIYIYDYNGRWSASPYSVQVNAEQDYTLYGDVNNDGLIDVGDVILILRHIAGIETLSDNQLVLANVNNSTDSFGNPTIDIGDAILISRYILRLVSKFPIE